MTSAITGLSLSGLDGLKHGVDIAGVHVSYGLLLAAFAIIAAILIFVATKLAGRIIVSAGATILVAWLTNGGYIHVW